EENRAMGKLRFGFGWESDRVEELQLFGFGAIDEVSVELRFAPVIDPGKTASHGDLTGRLVDHHEVHELRNACIARAAGAFVAWDDPIRKYSDSRIFVRCKKLWLKACA